MGINSFITHRMFVAALSHDEDTSAKDAQRQRVEESARDGAAKIPQDARFSALTQAESATRRWAMSASTVVF